MRYLPIRTARHYGTNAKEPMTPFSVSQRRDPREATQVGRLSNALRAQRAVVNRAASRDVRVPAAGVGDCTVYVCTTYASVGPRIDVRTRVVRQYEEHIPARDRSALGWDTGSHWYTGDANRRVRRGQGRRGRRVERKEDGVWAGGGC